MYASNEMMVKRLKKEMQRTGINARELSDRAKVGRSFVYDILSGKSSNPTTQKISAIASILGVSVPYLIDNNKNDNEILNDEDNNFALIHEFSIVGDDGLKLESRQSDKSHFFRSDWIKNTLNTNADNLYIYKFTDDSMSPELLNGDLLMIDTSRKSPSPPGIFAIYDGAGLAIKRLEYIRKNGVIKIMVKSDNSKYASYECDPQDINILGKAVWLSRNLL